MQGNSLDREGPSLAAKAGVVLVAGNNLGLPGDVSTRGVVKFRCSPFVQMVGLKRRT